MSEKLYLLFDGRWFSDPDRALVLCTNRTIKGALEDYEMFSQDAVIVLDDVAVYCELTKLDLTKELR